MIQVNCPCGQAGWWLEVDEAFERACPICGLWVNHAITIPD